MKKWILAGMFMCVFSCGVHAGEDEAAFDTGKPKPPSLEKHPLGEMTRSDDFILDFETPKETYGKKDFPLIPFTFSLNHLEGGGSLRPYGEHEAVFHCFEKNEVECLKEHFKNPHRAVFYVLIEAQARTSLENPHLCKYDAELQEFVNAVFECQAYTRMMHRIACDGTEPIRFLTFGEFRRGLFQGAGYSFRGDGAYWITVFYLPNGFDPERGENRYIQSPTKRIVIGESGKMKQKAELSISLALEGEKCRQGQSIRGTAHVANSGEKVGGFFALAVVAEKTTAESGVRWFFQGKDAVEVSKNGLSVTLTAEFSAHFDSLQGKPLPPGKYRVAALWLAAPLRTFGEIGHISKNVQAYAISEVKTIEVAERK